MKTSYCEKWWLARKIPIQPMDTEIARRRHEAHEPYVALVGGDQPRFVIEVSGDWVSVVFLNQNLRQYLRYDYKAKQSNRLFLKTATHWEYAAGSERETLVKIFSFSENGRIVMEERDGATSEVKELETVASVQENWDLYPAFGDYVSICREQR
jgi:hypothetical protein